MFHSLIPPSSLWLDFYALTMAQALFNDKRHDAHSVFHLYVRDIPFKGGYMITAGQEIIWDWLDQYQEHMQRDIVFLRAKNIFTDDFLKMVETTPLKVSIQSFLEGDIAFANEPILKVSGPLWQCLWLEGALLNSINSQTLFATLAARICQATRGGKVYDFGLRRAQSLGALEVARASYIGGIEATSNVLSEQVLGIPSGGTFAHAFVMSYEDEQKAYEIFAQSFPHQTTFLIDTYHSIEGLKKAIEAAKLSGITPKAIRLDSGDLAYLSKQARKLLDQAGFLDTEIMGSNDLDEYLIESILTQGAPITLWGVGTHLATSKHQSALGAVYKLGHIEERNVIKLSEQEFKISLSGDIDILRVVRDQKYDGDVLIRAADKNSLFLDGALQKDINSHRYANPLLVKKFATGTHVVLPLKDIFIHGKRVMAPESLLAKRKRVQQALNSLNEESKRLQNPHKYVVGMDQALWQDTEDTKRKAAQNI
jgi:nicotinate phosphoribosyltransferase